jgi:hypothetical protein
MAHRTLQPPHDRSQLQSYLIGAPVLWVAWHTAHSRRPSVSCRARTSASRTGKSPVSHGPCRVGPLRVLPPLPRQGMPRSPTYLSGGIAVLCRATDSDSRTRQPIASLCCSSTWLVGCRMLYRYTGTCSEGRTCFAAVTYTRKLRRLARLGRQYRLLVPQSHASWPYHPAAHAYIGRR